jgi:hypothetical protein
MWFLHVCHHISNAVYLPFIAAYVKIAIRLKLAISKQYLKILRALYMPVKDLGAVGE